MRIEDIVHVTPADWPRPGLQVMPGDLATFAPNGNGVGGALLPVMPYDGAGAQRAKQSFYGFHGRSGHPLRDAPLTEAYGGTVYFGRATDLPALLGALGVRIPERRYAAFTAAAADPRVDGYLVQLRLVRAFGLRFMYRAQQDDIDKLPEQPHDVATVAARFLEQQTAFWSERDLTGKMGGDGDWASEMLAFGFMVENSYHGVYRLWSRAWLVTK